MLSIGIHRVGLVRHQVAVSPVAGLVATVVAGPSTFGHLTWDLLLAGLGLAVLLPVIPFSLELLALRRLSTDTFCTPRWPRSRQSRCASG
jgi:inner membrane transporter RhtA